MNDRETIIKLAREQGLPQTATEGVYRVNTDDLARMLAAEREACAQVAERVGQYQNQHGIAAAIRARGEYGK